MSVTLSPTRAAKLLPMLAAASSAVTLATPFANASMRLLAMTLRSVVAAVIDVDDVTVVVSVCTATLSAALSSASLKASKVICGDVSPILLPAKLSIESTAYVLMFCEVTLRSSDGASSTVCDATTISSPECSCSDSIALMLALRVLMSKVSPDAMRMSSAASISMIPTSFVPKLITVLEKCMNDEYAGGMERKRTPLTSCWLNSMDRPWKSSRSVRSGALHTPTQRCCSSLYRSRNTLPSAVDAVSLRRAAGDSGPPFSIQSRSARRMGFSSSTSASSKYTGFVHTKETVSDGRPWIMRNIAPCVSMLMPSEPTTFRSEPSTSTASVAWSCSLEVAVVTAPPAETWKSAPLRTRTDSPTVKSAEPTVA